MRFLASAFASTVLVLLSVGISEGKDLPNYRRSPGSGLSSLTDFTKQGIAALFQAKTDADFNNSVTAFFSDKVQLSINGASVPLSPFVAELRSERVNETFATFTFYNTIEAPSNASDPTAAGAVGVFYKTAITEKTIVKGKHVVESNLASVNVVIIQDPDVVRPAGHSGTFDSRRVVQLNRISPPLEPSS